MVKREIKKEIKKKQQIARVKDHVEVHVYVLSVSQSLSTFFFVSSIFHFSLASGRDVKTNSRRQFNFIDCRVSVSENGFRTYRFEGKRPRYYQTSTPRIPFSFCQQRDKDKNERLSDKSFLGFFFMCEHVLMTY